MPLHPLQCRCGALRGHVDTARAMTRAVCYCRDCQAFARALHRGDDVLDAAGGTHIVATSPRGVVFTQGEDRLACLSLSPQGLLRWHTTCCRTPIGNTPRQAAFSYVGLVHSVLQGPGAPPLEASFGPVRLVLNTGSAIGPLPAHARAQGRAGAFARLAGAVAWSRLGGGWKTNPFFDTATGAPVRAPRVLTRDERAAASAPAP